MQVTIDERENMKKKSDSKVFLLNVNTVIFTNRLINKYFNIENYNLCFIELSIDD